MDREALAEPPAIEIYRAALAARRHGGPENALAAGLHDSIRASGFLCERQTASNFAILSRRTISRARLDLHWPTWCAPGQSKARASDDSNILTVRIYPPPEAPRDVRVAVTESAIVVTWTEPPRRRALLRRLSRVPRRIRNPAQEAAAQDLSQAKLKSPLELAGSSSSTDFQRFAFRIWQNVSVHGSQRGAIRRGFGGIRRLRAGRWSRRVTSFRPPRPLGLEAAIIPATPQAPAYVELSWAISPEGDLAGYHVYRSDRKTHRASASTPKYCRARRFVISPLCPAGDISTVFPRWTAPATKAPRVPRFRLKFHRRAIDEL